MPHPNINIGTLVNNIGQQSFKFLKGFLDMSGIKFDHITCTQKKEMIDEDEFR